MAWIVIAGIAVVGVVLAAVLMVVAGGYNRLVMLRERYRNAFSQIDVQLRRRYDLVPNLIETVKGSMAHERQTLEAVIAARAQAVSAAGAAKAKPGDASAMAGLAAAEGALSGALGRLMVVSEAYPDLKASATMAQLSDELSATENSVAFARQAFNDAVTEYNTTRQSVPTVFYAGLVGHAMDAALLKFEDSAKIQQAPKVAF
ncbi:MAG: LemA family protein [Isosphaera sp.]|nr:LemA family protein [Isosphaera sp.]